MQHPTTPTTDELRTAVSAAELEVQAALGKVREARMRHASALAAQGVPTDTLGNVEGDNRDWCLGDAAEMEAKAALRKVREARQKLARTLWETQGVPTDALGNEGDKRVWCLGDEGDCMGDCGGRFHDPGPRQGPRDYDIRF